VKNDEDQANAYYPSADLLAYESYPVT